ncbi:MAG: helix-turn-helix domain-containing protein [Nannocystaceae bacterium]
MRVPTGRLWVVEDPEPQSPLQGVDAGPPSPGRYIRDQRLRRGMTLEEVSAKTKIPRASLEALEEERWSALPGPVFVKGFLRCCARALEIDDQVVLDLLYEQERAKMRAEHEPEPEPEPRPALGRRPGPPEREERGADLPATSGRPQPWSGLRREPPAARVGAEPAPEDRPPPSAYLRELFERVGAVASRLPGANILLWVAVALLIVGLVFAVLLAFGAQQAMTPQT